MLRSLRLPAAVAALALLLAAAISTYGAPNARATAPSNDDFERTWARTDEPVASSQVARTWIWGPEANTGSIDEEYAESPGHVREVQYYDKSRMEINDPGGDRSDPFFVTNGLLVVELMTGRMQVGDNSFQAYQPAQIGVAGDPDDTSGPTYAAMGGLRAAPPAADGATIIQTITHDGVIGEDDSLASWGITAAYHVQVPGINHQVASVFWDFMNSSGTVFVDGAYTDEQLFLNPFYATGFPITEAYFAQVKVAGDLRTVLVQCFERRCLTWTPGNSPGFETEAGNVGLHYHYWRYVLVPAEGQPTATPTEGGPTATASETVTETATATETVTNGPAYEFDSAWGGEVDPGTELDTPLGVATDNDGNVYVLDSGNDRVVKFDDAGRVLDQWGSSGDAEGELSAPQGIFVGVVYGDEVVMVADSLNDRVHKFGTDGHSQGTFGESGDSDDEFTDPTGVAAHGSDVFVVDSGNNRVMHYYANDWSKNPTEIGEGEGDGSGEFESPYAIAADNTGYVYVVDQGNSRVQVFDVLGNFVSFIGNTDNDDELDMPVGIAIDSSRRAYVVDQALGTVKVFEKDGNDWSYVGSIGEQGDGVGEFDQPNGIAIDPQGFVYVTDIGTNSVLKFAPFDEGHDFIGSWSSGQTGNFSTASGIAARDGRVLVTDTTTNDIQVFDTNGEFIDSLGSPGNDEGEFQNPTDVDVDGQGRIYVADHDNGRIQKFKPSLGFDISFGDTGSSAHKLDAPLALAVYEGDVYVADEGKQRVMVFSDDGNYVTSWGSEGDDEDFDNVSGIAVYDDVVYVVEQGQDRVQMFDTDGTYIGSFGESGSGTGEFGRPSRVAVNDDGFVFVTDESRNRVLVFTPQGDYLSTIGRTGDGDGEFAAPVDLAFDEDNTLYVVDAGNHRIQLFVPND